MFPTSLKPLALIILGVASFLGSNAAASAQEAGTVWVTSLGGRFTPDQDTPGRWVESTHLKTVYYFDEVERCTEYVEIHDASRGVTIRLHDTACYIRHSGTGGEFQLLYHGAWR
jgi:hypothetical protein